MPRLFTTERETDFFSDITKEIIKDVAGQKIYYYPISIVKTDVHEIYEEAPEKIFDTAIEIECLVDWKQPESTATTFGYDEMTTLEIYIHARDMYDKGIQLIEGDFFSFGPRFFEISSVIPDQVIHGQIEYITGWKLTGVQARKGQFDSKLIGPTSERFSDDDAVQTEFAQQRGNPENQHGVTGDRRALRDRGVLEAPIDSTRVVSDEGASDGSGSSFYDE